MEQEALVLHQVDKLRHKLESTRHESQDWAAEATGARAVELRAVEWATAAERELDATKVHLAETEAALQKSLEALEAERKARSEADREVLTLWGQVLGWRSRMPDCSRRSPSKRKGSPSLKLTTSVCICSAFG